MRASLPLMKSVPLSLAKSVLIPLELSAGMSAADAAIQKKISGSGHPSGLASHTAALIISNEEMEHIMKIVKSLEESEAIKNEAKEQKAWFLQMLLGKLATSILWNALAWRAVIKVGDGVIGAGENF